MTTPKARRKSIRKAARGRIVKRGIEWSRKSIEQEFCSVALAVIDETVQNGYLYISFGDDERAPSLNFEDAEGYSFRSMPLLKHIESELQWIKEYPDNEIGRNDRFMIHLRKAVRDFMRSERQREKAGA